MEITTRLHNANSDIRRAHLALIDGGKSHSSHAVQAAHESAVSTVQTPRLQRRQASATFVSQNHETPRTRHEGGVIAVAQQYNTFEEALLPMVLASGVKGEAAAAIAKAIKSQPALLQQAENAYRHARMGVAK